MSPTSFEPLALRAHRLFETRDLDETREHISRVMQPHALLPSSRVHGPSHMDFVRLGGLGIGTIAFGDAMRVQVDAVDGYYLLMFCLSGHADVRAMGRFIGADSLAFISIDGLYRAMGEAGRDPAAPKFCDACFTGDYPIALTDHEAGKVSIQLSLLAETA
jgi:hypothetical protein